MKNILEKLESYVFMKKMLDEDKCTIIFKENFHNNIKINDSIKLYKTFEDKSGYYARNVKELILEILYTEKFYTIRIVFDFYGEREETKFKNILRQFYLNNRNNKEITINSYTDRFSAKFNRMSDFTEFFDKYILGEDVCNLP